MPMPMPARTAANVMFALFDSTAIRTGSVSLCR
jgi:hypothetical protein